MCWHNFSLDIVQTSEYVSWNKSLTKFLQSEPESSYIWIDYASFDLKEFPYDEKFYEISVFSDVNCTKYLDTVVPSDNVMAGKHDSDCVFMGEGVQWKSVMPLAEFIGNGVNKSDDTDTWGNAGDR